MFDRVLGELAELDPEAAEVVQLSVFTGLTIDETAQALQIDNLKSIGVKSTLRPGKAACSCGWESRTGSR